MAFPVSWIKKVKLTVDPTKVVGASDFTNFPVLITEANLPAGVFTNAQGQEINTNWLLTDANLKGYWRLESNGTDETANNNDLSALNAPSHAAAIFTNGIDMEAGSSQNYNIAHASQTGLDMTGSRTICGWIQLESLGAGNSCIASKRGEDNSFRGYDLHIRSDGTPELEITGLTTNSSVTHTKAAQVGKKHFICGVYDSANNKLKIWIDGHKVEVTASGSSIDSGKQFAIGSTYAGSGNTAANFFDGLIDDVAVFDRALTDTEVMAIYTGGADIRASLDALGTTQYACEVVTLDRVNSTAEIWVKIPTLSTSANTILYIWYGNSTATPDARDSTFGSDNVWESNFKAVYHFNGNGNDSTVNQYNLDNESGSPTYAAGKVGKAMEIRAASTQYKYGNSTASGINMTASQTWFGWRTPRDATNMGSARILQSGVAERYLRVLSGVIRMQIDGLTPSNVNSGVIGVSGTPLFTAGRYDSSGGLLDVIGNVTKTSTAVTGSPSAINLASTDDNLCFGRNTSGNTAQNTDESFFAIYSGGLSDDWLGTFYANTNDPATFITESAQESASASLSPSASVSPSSSVSPSPSRSLSPSASSSRSLSPSASASPSSSVSVSASRSVSPSASVSASTSPSASVSPSSSISKSPSPSASVSRSTSPSVSPSLSPSMSTSPSISPSASASPSGSQSPSASVSHSVSPSVSPSPTEWTDLYSVPTTVWSDIYTDF